MVGGVLGVAAGDGEHGGGRMDLETWGTWGGWRLDSHVGSFYFSRIPRWKVGRWMGIPNALHAPPFPGNA